MFALIKVASPTRQQIIFCIFEPLRLSPWSFLKEKKKRDRGTRWLYVAQYVWGQLKYSGFWKYQIVSFLFLLTWWRIAEMNLYRKLHMFWPIHLVPAVLMMTARRFFFSFPTIPAMNTLKYSLAKNMISNKKWVNLISMLCGAAHTNQVIP